MPYYHVGSNPIAVKSAKGKNLVLDQDAVLKALDEEYQPANPDAASTIEVFDNLAAAQKFAREGVDAKSQNQFIIFKVDIAKAAKKKKSKVDLLNDKDEVVESLPSFVVSETDATLTHWGRADHK